MTIHELNNHLQQLTANPSRETAVEFSKALMQLLGVQSEQKEKTLGGYTQTLQKLLAENPRVKNQSLLYQLSSAAQNISCRFAVVKKINKPTLLRLCYQENFAQSWQANIGIAGTDKLPYTLDFITTEKYNAVTAVITQGEQIRTITFKEKLSNLQLNKILRVWQNIIAKPKAAINSDLWSSLDLKEVNKQFYISIKEKFDALIAEIKEQYPKAQPNETKMFAIHLIGRYIFCWFLKEKEIIHPDVLSSASLEKYKDRYNKICKRLFFDTLNSFPYPERNYPKDVPAELLKHLSEIPYLNGGLFEPSIEDEIIPSLNIDGWLLSFIRLLEEYNFTVDESSANYEQVAIDPEMLGRILENLLASLNPETEKIANERNALGAFYTPRPIVDYMVTESLKAFFESQLSDEVKEEAPDDNFFTTDKSKNNLFSDMQPKQMAIDVNKLAEQKETKEKLREKIDKLFDYTIEQNPFNANDTRKLKQALNEIKIIDPACGSGAFPMGVLHKLEMLHEKFGTDKSPYDLRRMILSQNIYGVDILPMAVEISRLRAWLALVLVNEYKRSDRKHNFNIKALPNLDFKFVCANTLVDSGYDDFVHLVDKAKTPTLMRLEGEIQKLESIKEKFFNSNSTDHQKQDLIAEFHQTKNYIKTEFALLKKSYNLSDFLKKIDDWNPFNDNSASSFFSPSWMFSISDGFDIVIGNPPYVEFKKLKNKELYKSYRTAKGKYDLYVLFIERSQVLLKKDGVFCFINPTTFMMKDYGAHTRQFIVNNYYISEILDFGDIQIFESATNYTGIFLFVKRRNVEGYNFYYQRFFSSSRKISEMEFVKGFQSKSDTNFKNVITVKSARLTEDTWMFQTDTKTKILDKIIGNKTHLLSEITKYIFVGIQSGKDEVFFIDDDIIKQNKIEKGVAEPILKGKDVGRYSINWSGTYIIYPYDKKTNEPFSEAVFKSKFPNAYRYLRGLRESLSGRDYFDKSNKLWFELWCERIYSKFKEKKIVNSEISPENRFSLDTDGYLDNTKIFNTVLKESYADFYPCLLGIINSSVLEFYHKNFASPKAGGFYDYKTQFIENYPIAFPNKSTRKKIESLVAKILTAKNKNPQADSSKEERQIDVLVFHLYNLTYEEAKIIDATLNVEEFEKHKL